MTIIDKNYTTNFVKAAGVKLKGPLTRLSLHLLFLILSMQIAYSQINWQQTNGPYGGVINALAINSSGTIFAGTSGGVYSSTNNGTNWNKTDLTHGTVNSFAINSSGYIFAGTSGGVYRSTNNGANWTLVNSGLTYADIRSLAINSSGYIFAGILGGGVYLSTNNGTSWTPVNNGLTESNVQSLTINSSGSIFAGTSTGGIYRSTDNGTSWTPVNNGLTESNVQSLTINSSGYIFAGTNNGGVFLSTNSGTSWTPVNNGLMYRNIRSLAINSSGYIFAGTIGNGVYLSMDNGTSWIQANIGLTTSYVYSLAINSSGYIFAGTVYGGVYLSTDNGTNWIQINNGLTNINIQSLAVNSSGYIFAGTLGDGVYLSTNNGTSWMKSGLTNNSVLSLVINSSDYIFAGTGSGVYLSTDNGVNWIQVNNGLTNSIIQSLVINSSGYIFAGTGSGVYLSTDNGTIWTHVNNGLPQNYIHSLAINSSGHIFAGTNTLGVYLSKDNGTSWMQVNNGLTSNFVLSLAINSSGYVYVGTSSGVYLSTDNGSSWTPINNGLTQSYIQSLTINSSGYIFAGTNGGVFLSKDSGTSWTDSGLLNDNIQSLVINSSGYIYAGTSSNSVYSSLNSTLSFPPTITSFTPTSGSIGTAVTITGMNFNTTATNNCVYFGAVKAKVTAATSTSLSVTVPIGATFQPITVTDITTGLTAYSNAPFIVTFTGGGSITSASFAAKVDFTTWQQPLSVAIGDVDGDGKPDLAVANGSSSTVSVFRNTGTIGSVSFAAKVDFTTGSFSVAIGDVDGDGKPDLVVANYGSNIVSVFRNTSISGSVSFAAKVDFTTGSGPQSIAIGDIDGDGKPDLAVANYDNNTVSIFRNTGTIGSVSFAAKVDFSTGTYPISVAIGDVDGDGKPDLAVANWRSNTVSVFRNTSTIGSVLFAAKVDFTTGSTPRSVAIGDVDGDGKPDLAVAIDDNNTVSIFRNTGTIGSVSFASKVDFTTGSAAFSVAIGDVDGDGKPDLAVVNGSSTVSVFRNTGTSGSVSFATKVDFSTGLNPFSVAIGDVDGDGKPDLTVANYNSNTVSVLRNTIVGGNIAPAIPQNLTATVGNGQVILKWNKNTESDFLRYLIYSGISANPKKIIDSTSGGIADTVKLISGLTNGVIYYFSITAVDNMRSESWFSNEVSATPTSGPVLLVNPTILSFGDIEVSTTSPEKTYSLFGANLSPASGNVTVTAPTGFEVSLTSGSGFASSKNVTYASGTFSTTIYVRFKPVSLISYGGNITNTGGGATTQSVAVSGTGVQKNIAPSAPTAAQIVPSGWTNQNTFNITWTNPSDPSGIAKVWYIIDTIPTISSPGTAVVNSAQTLQVNISSVGTHQIFFYLENGTGNKDPNNYVRIDAKYDNLIPAIQHDSLSVSTFEISSPQAIGIQATATDAHSGMKTLQMQYKRAGLGWSTAVTANYPNSGGGVASIPIVDISSYAKDGVDYRIIAADSAGNIGYTPTHSILIHTNATVTRTDALGNPITQMSVSTLPTGTPTEYAYRLFSVPLSLENRTPYDVLENRTGLGAYDVKKWRFFRWNSTSGDFEDYSVFANDQIISPGAAFFLIIKSGTVIKVGPGSIIKSDEFYKNGLPLTLGYNFVGNPFGFDVSMDSLSLADGTSLLNKTWSFVGVGGTNAGWQPNPLTLKAWEGIVMKLTAPNTLRFNIADRPHASIHPAASMKRMEKVDSTKLWMVRIKAIRTDNAVTDEENLFGISGDIQPSLCEPPMVGEKSVSLLFDSPDGAITHDFRSASDSGWVWDFRVATPDVGSEVQLKFENIERAGNGYLLDKTSKIVYKLDELLNLKPNTINREREYRIIVGSKEFAGANNLGIDLEPKSFALYQNYPNPFNPSTRIRYSLTEPSNVKLTIYDVLGREIAVLLNGEVTAGYREVEWRAMVSTGIYFYHLEAISIDNPQHRLVETKKMILLK